jgi:DNA-binding NarL/FixJ family response regulator
VEGLAAGELTVQLAAQLHFSRQGVEYRISRLLRKFDAANRAALVARAYTMGLLCADSWPPKVMDAHTF